jgi:hypothetical protein
MGGQAVTKIRLRPVERGFPSVSPTAVANCGCIKETLRKDFQRCPYPRFEAATLAVIQWGR